MSILSYVKDEIQVIRERDPAIKSNMEVFLYPSFKVILNYRIAVSEKAFLLGKMDLPEGCTKDRD